MKSLLISNDIFRLVVTGCILFLGHFVAAELIDPL